MDQRLLCPGCSHNVQEPRQEPDAFRYLTIDEMKTAGYRCKNINCQVYIEEEQLFTEITDAVSKWTNNPLVSFICTDADVLSSFRNMQILLCPTRLTIPYPLTASVSRLATGSVCRQMRATRAPALPHMLFSLPFFLKLCLLPEQSNPTKAWQPTTSAQKSSQT